MPTKNKIILVALKTCLLNVNQSSPQTVQAEMSIYWNESASFIKGSSSQEILLHGERP